MYYKSQGRHILSCNGLSKVQYILESKLWVNVLTRRYQITYWEVDRSCSSYLEYTAKCAQSGLNEKAQRLLKAKKDIVFLVHCLFYSYYSFGR